VHRLPRDRGRAADTEVLAYVKGFTIHCRRPSCRGRQVARLIHYFCMAFDRAQIMHPCMQ
jgi:hypothetical protein